MFNNLFGSKNEQPKDESMWLQLTSVNQLDDLHAQSSEMPVLIFKHSTRCSISRMALRQFESDFNKQGQIALYFLDLLRYRDVSDQIASRFRVQHQSPQAILIKEGQVVYHDSHGQIDAERLGDYII